MTPACLNADQWTEPDRTRPRPRPLISVIVPVRNEARFIRRTLEQLLDQHYPPDRFEVLVADGRSTDDTVAIVSRLASRHANLRLLDNPGRLSSAGRNRAVAEARGDIILLVDGHCDLANPHYLADLADAFARSGADCVGRPQPLDVRDATPLQRAIAAARSCWLGHQPASFIYSDKEQFVPPQSVAIAYRRAVFERLGLFDESFDACEDVEFNQRVARAGLRCFFAPKVRVYYHPRRSLRGLFFQMSRYGRGRVRLLRKYPETFSPACMAPGAFVVGLVAGAALALVSGWVLAAYAATLGLYGLLMVAASIQCLVNTRDRQVLPWLPLVLVTIHLGAGFGILSEAVTRRRQVANTIPELPAERNRTRAA